MLRKLLGRKKKKQRKKQEALDPPENSFRSFQEEEESSSSEYRMLKGDMMIRTGHYEVIRDVVEEKVVVRRLRTTESYEEFSNDFIVIFPYHRIIWDLRTPVALQCRYLRALTTTEMSTSHSVVEGRHFVIVDDEKPPIDQFHPSAFSVAGLVLCYGATVNADQHYDKYKIAEICAERVRQPYSSYLGHVDRCNSFKDVLSFLQYIHLREGGHHPSTTTTTTTTGDNLYGVLPTTTIIQQQQQHDDAVVAQIYADEDDVAFDVVDDDDDD